MNLKIKGKTQINLTSSKHNPGSQNLNTKYHFKVFPLRILLIPNTQRQKRQSDLAAPRKVGISGEDTEATKVNWKTLKKDLRTPKQLKLDEDILVDVWHGSAGVFTKSFGGEVKSEDRGWRSPPLLWSAMLSSFCLCALS